MSMLEIYKDQVELLLDVLPFIQDDPKFALKGGTAINLFYRNMPRLSVDIDLTYLPIEPRPVFLKNLTTSMKDLSKKLEKNKFYVEKQDNNIIKLLVSNDKTTIKIEPNTILRGSVFPTETKELSESAQNIFLQTQKVKILSIADIYGGKICAALDRQHPRDLFDIKLLFENEGITDSIRQAFIVYLASSPRPMNELLSPNRLDLEEIFNKEFIGMTEQVVDYSELSKIREKLINTINSELLDNEREFLLSVKSGNPQWNLIPIPNISDLPGIKWKVININKMDKSSRQKAMDKLRSILEN